MTNHHTFRRLAPACILLSLAAASCGSDDGTLTEAEYREAANAVCTAAEAELGAIFGAIFPKIDTATEAERQAATDGLLEVLGKEIDDLDALVPPDDIADDVDAMIDAVRAAEVATREQGAGFWLDETDLFADAEQRAASLGLDACAGDSSQ